MREQRQTILVRNAQRPSRERPRLLPASIELSCGPISAIDLGCMPRRRATTTRCTWMLRWPAQRLRAPVVHGMLTMAYLTRLFTANFGAGAC